MGWSLHRRARASRVVVVGVTLALLCGAGLLATSAGAGPGSPGEPRTAASVEQVERQRLTALVDVRLDVLQRRHASEFEIVPPPGLPLTRDEYLDLIGSGDLDYLVFEPVSPITVRVHGDAATLWYRSKIDIVAAGLGRFTHEAWHLYLYEHRGGTWQVVREQATAVGGFPPPAPAGP